MSIFADMFEKKQGFYTMTKQEEKDVNSMLCRAFDALSKYTFVSNFIPFTYLDLTSIPFDRHLYFICRVTET